MKIKIVAAVAVTALLVIGANGQGAGGAGGTAGSGTGGTATGGATGTGTSGGVVNGVNAVPNNPSGINSGVVTPIPNQGNRNILVTPPVNPNTPIVGNGMGTNNLSLGSNSLALGTNNLRLGSNQFALRTNGLGKNFLTPTGPNGSGFLSNSLPPNPNASTNIILLNP